MTSLPFPDDDCTPRHGESIRSCRKCGESKSIGEFYFYGRSGKPYSRCKVCSRSDTGASRAKLDPAAEAAKRKAKYEANREDRVEAARAYREKKRAENPGPPKVGDDGPRRCKDCGEVKDRSEFYVRNKATGAIFTRCKPCHNALTSIHSAKRYSEDPERYRKATRDYVAANREEVNRLQRERRQADIDAVRRTERERESTPEYKATRAKYRLKNAEHRRAYNAEYRRKNKSKHSAYNAAYSRQFPEVYRAASRKWQARNPLKAAANRRTARHKRRTIMANVEGTFTDVEWLAIKERQDYTCLMCGFREPFVKLTVDHVIPISKGGTNYASNLAAICDWCNSVKKDRIIDYKTYFKTRPKPRRRPARRPA